MNNFSKKRFIYMEDVDASKNIYMPRAFAIAIGIFEDFLREKKMPLYSQLRKEKWALPIVHAEADFLAPLYYGMEVDLFLTFLEFKKNSFTYQVSFGSSQERFIQIRLSHVLVDVTTREKIPIDDFHEIIDHNHG